MEPEWQLLLAELDKFYSDKETFVVIIAGCLAAWCKSLIELLDDEANEEWTETLLEHLNNARLRLFIEVGIRIPGCASWPPLTDHCVYQNHRSGTGIRRQRHG